MEVLARIVRLAALVVRALDARGGTGRQSRLGSLHPPPFELRIWAGTRKTQAPAVPPALWRVCVCVSLPELGCWRRSRHCPVRCPGWVWTGRGWGGVVCVCVCVCAGGQFPWVCVVAAIIRTHLASDGGQHRGLLDGSVVRLRRRVAEEEARPCGGRRGGCDGATGLDTGVRLDETKTETLWD